MVEFDCCGTQELLSKIENDGDEVENDADGDFVGVNVKTPVKRKKLSCLMLCELLRHSREVQPNPPNFLGRKDVCFKKLHGTCDSIFRTLHEDDIGAEKTYENCWKI